MVCTCFILGRIKNLTVLFREQVKTFALVNTKQPCDWKRPQLGRQQRELTKLIRRGWHVKVSCGSGVGSITYVSFVVGEVAPLFVNWWRFALPSLWVEALTCGGPDSERRLLSLFFFFLSLPTPAPPAVPLLPKPTPSQNSGRTTRWATPVKEWTPPQPRHLNAACPPATALSGPCSLNAHFVPLSTGLIDINSCAQSAHSVFSWSDAVGVCVIIFNGSLFQVRMKYEQFGHWVNDNLCKIHWKLLQHVWHLSKWTTWLG